MAKQLRLRRGTTTQHGSFTGADGVGEGNLSGARITIIRSGGGIEGACCLGGSCSILDAVICQALGGEYQGEGTDFSNEAGDLAAADLLQRCPQQLDPGQSEPIGAKGGDPQAEAG